MVNRNQYTLAGFSLIVAGSLLLALSSLILHLTWLTATGIAMLILSAILLALGRTIPKLSPEVSSLFLETGIDNISSIVEELGIKSKAIYLPSSLANGRPRALIPLHSNPAPPPITHPLSRRLVVRYGAGPDDVGLLLTVPGTIAVSMLESKPGPTSTELEAALNSLFVGILGVADRVKVITNENQTRVEIYNPRLENKATWGQQCLGGPLPSIVASLAAEAWNKPVIINQEEYHKGKYSIELEVIGEDI